MKLSLMQENLARGLSLVSRAVSTRASLPVLTNVLLRTQDGGLRLTATNLEIGISAWVPGKIEVDGALTVPARLIADIVAGLPAGERVDLEVENEHTLRIRAGRFQTHLRGIDADEFPVIPAGRRAADDARDPEGHAPSALGGHVRGRDRRDPSDPHGRPDPVRRRGGHARRGRQLPHRGQDPGPAVIGRGDLDRRARAILRRAHARPRRHRRAGRHHPRPGEEPGHLPRRYAPSWSAGSSTASSPTTSQVLPTSHSTRAVVDRDELLKAVRLSALIASSAANVVKLRFGEDGSDGVTIAAAADVGDAEGQVEAALEGDAVRSHSMRATSPRRSRTWTATSSRSSSAGRSSPGVLKPVDDRRTSTSIMPVRTPS